mmetsp:Transcript_11031/g.29634  ORF Transcript_11031/g.29634 Transcript_11031/m.29634 type:complete len:98 (+) Transcript_11031:178-471(+)
MVAMTSRSEHSPARAKAVPSNLCSPSKSLRECLGAPPAVSHGADTKLLANVRTDDLKRTRDDARRVPSIAVIAVYCCHCRLLLSLPPKPVPDAENLL